MTQLALTQLTLSRLFGRDYERVPEGIARRYAHLERDDIEPLEGGGSRLGKARLWRRGRLRILSVKGDRYEMAYQHGRLLADDIAGKDSADRTGGSIEQAAAITVNAIRGAVGDGPLSKLVSFYADRAITERMLRAGIREAASRGDDSMLEAYGLSAATGIPVRTLTRAVLGPETAQTLLGKTQGLAVGYTPQCSSFAAWGEHTADGEVVIGRNTDYPLTGFYDRAPTVVYFDPDDAQKFMAVTSAGFHNAGVIGLNESGLFLAIHTVPTTSVSTVGTPVFMLGQEVLRSARNIDEAVDMLQARRPAAGWNYKVVSTRERRAATVELCADHASVRWADSDCHVTTNHWSKPDMETHNLFVNHSIEECTRARFERLQQLVAAADGPIDAATAAQFMADSVDQTVGETRLLGNILATNHTVSSVVGRPVDGVVYVATGTAPVSRGEYVGLPTPDRFDPGTFEPGAHGTVDPGVGRGAADRAMELYIRAKDALEYDHDLDGAAELLERAAKLHDDPSFAIVLGVVQANRGRYQRAAEVLGEAVPRESRAHGQRFGRYALGRALCAAGDTAAGGRELSAVASDGAADPKLRAAAKRCAGTLLRRGKLPMAAKEITLMGFLADAYRYQPMFGLR